MVGSTLGPLLNEPGVQGPSSRSRTSLPMEGDVLVLLQTSRSPDGSALGVIRGRPVEIVLLLPRVDTFCSSSTSPAVLISVFYRQED